MHKQYLENGPVKYIGKLDSVKVHSGLNRVVVRANRPSDPEATVLKIHWTFEGVAGVMEANMAEVTDAQNKVSVSIDNLEEGDYTFYITTHDDEGHSSVPVEVSGAAYGERVQSGLRNVPLQGATYDNGKLTINWGPMSGITAQRSEITYSGADGLEKVVQVNIGVQNTVIDDFLPEGTLKYRTAHLLDTTAIDTLYVPFEKIPYRMSIPRSGWAATASSFDNRPASYRPPDNAIDGNPNTVWVNYVGGTPGIPAALHPHIITIDMGSVHEGLEGFEIITRVTAGARSREVEFYTSMDNDNWTLVNARILQNVGTMQTILLTTPVQAQYFRMVTRNSYGAGGDNSTDANVALAEIGMYKVFNK